MSREGRMDTVDLGMPSVRPQHASPSSHLRGTRGFPAAARDALADEVLRGNLTYATSTIQALSLIHISEPTRPY